MPFSRRLEHYGFSRTAQRNSWGAFGFFVALLYGVAWNLRLTPSEQATARRSWSYQTGDSTSSKKMPWAQHEFALQSYKRGCHLITDEIVRGIGSSLSQYKVGIANVFLLHTSASLTINENTDPDVRGDTETFLNLVVPEGGKAPWRHADEGPDDMPAHLKSSMFGVSLTVPIRNGKLALGTWQGIWLCEHRAGRSVRKVLVTLQGE